MFVHIVPCNPAHMQCADSNLGFGTEWDASAFGVCMLVMSVFLGYMVLRSISAHKADDVMSLQKIAS
jgi:hypothetical protein